MPFLVAAVAGAAASYFVAGAVIATVGAVAAYAIGALAGGIVSGVLNQAFAKKPDQNTSEQFAAQARGLLINSTANDAPIPVIYGSRRVGGTRTLTEVSGASNEFLHVIIVIGEGQISGINTVYLDDVDSSDARFAGLVTIERYVGADSQAASAALIAALGGKWTSEHRGAGVAYVYVRLQFSDAAFNGLPTITADVDGKLVYDTRDTVTKFSHNAGLCARDYLTNARYGRGIATASMDDTALSAAANECDVLVSTPAGSQVRYTCDGVVDTGRQVMDNVRDLLSACRGMLIFTGGLYQLIIDQAETPTAFGFTEDNIVGAWSIALAGKKTRVNRVRASIFNPARSWQPDFADWDDEAARADDNGLVLQTEIALPFTADLYRGQQIAQIEGKQSRYGLVPQFTATIAGLNCEVGQVVPITHSTPGWTAKPFRILRMELLSSDEVRVTAREYQDSVYALDDLDAADDTPATNLPNPFAVAAPGVPMVTESLVLDGRRVAVLATITWGAAADAFVTEYQVEYRAAGSATWQVIGRTSDLKITVLDIAPGIYDVRVKAINTLGKSSAYATRSGQEILGLSARPQTLAGLSIQKIGSQALLMWTLTADLDVEIGGRILIRHCESTTAPTWEESFSIGNADGYPGGSVIAVVPLKAGTYLLKAEDSSGLQSATAATVLSDGGTALTFSPLSSVTEDATFPGTHSSTIAIGGVLKITSAGYFDDIVNFDAVTSLDSTGSITGSGTYTFSTGIDLGSKKHVQLYSELQGITVNVNDRFDGRTGLIDDWLDFDGNQGGGSADAWVEARSTDTSPAGSPTPAWSAWNRLDKSEYNARGFEFRAQLRSYDPAYNIHVSKLRAYAQEIV